MTVVHMKVAGVTGKMIATSVETCLLGLTGVARVAVAGSIGLVSVLFDETRASTTQIVSALRGLGFRATPCATALAGA